MASQITSLTIVYSTVYSGADQRKHQSSASLSFVRGIHRWPVNSPHKGPVTQKMFPFDDVIMPTFILCIAHNGLEFVAFLRGAVAQDGVLARPHHTEPVLLPTQQGGGGGCGVCHVVVCVVRLTEHRDTYMQCRYNTVWWRSEYKTSIVVNYVQSMMTSWNGNISALLTCAWIMAPEQSGGWWFETPSPSLWRLCSANQRCVLRYIFSFRISCFKYCLCHLCLHSRFAFMLGIQVLCLFIFFSYLLSQAWSDPQWCETIFNKSEVNYVFLETSIHLIHVSFLAFNMDQNSV